ncbi:hypothetical protein PR003_g7943 [Phytophthora rubi]|uniref:Secreted protein n=1 Tax=Phytophthora rubi TaxID=129364 RepID=A0A6A3M290_9STRA|nr:hypothetical protein PR001_g12384 [Phytophthora rubi]KAE9345447.1 hypothetical protein PR003_g7943 [Phytophthora rubi]
MTNLSVASWNRNIFVFCLTWTLLCYPNFPRTTVVCTSPFLQKKDRRLLRDRLVLVTNELLEEICTRG